MNEEDFWIKRGKEHLFAQEWEDARDCFQRLNVQSLEPLLGLAQVEWAQGNEEKAKNLLERIANSYKKSGKVWIVYGRFYFVKDIEKAIHYFQKGIENEPECSEAHFWLGKAHIRNKKYLKAIENFERSIKLKPNDTSCLLELGNTYKILNRENDAKECFKRVYELKEGEEK